MTGKFLFAIAAGLLVGSAWLAPQHKTLSVPLREVPPLEYFVSLSSNPSFSQVQNAKAFLKADCLRSLSALRISLVANRIGPTNSLRPSTQSETVIAEPVLQREFVKALCKKIEEENGVQQECLLYQELLNTLKSGRLYNEWLDAYLHLLYERPTLPLVARLADTAGEFGVKTRRTGEVFRAFTLVTSIPFDFEGKNNVHTLLKDLNPHGLSLQGQTGLALN